jgi:putative oxidoreductase
MLWLRKLDQPAYAALRVVAGFMFTFHGLQKVFGVLSAKAIAPGVSWMFVGGLIELASGVLVAVGLFTRYAAFLASGTMAVAFFKWHMKGNFDDWQWLPIVNHGELAALYAFVFLVIAARGPGALSIDRAIDRDV